MNGILTRGLSAEETAMTEHILDQMAKNAFAYISNSTEEKSDDRSDSDRADA